MNITELARAIKETKEPVNDTILIYGESTVGKTRLAATIAKVPWVENVHWFDLENGHETIVNMYNKGILTEEEASKIILYRIPDAPDAPVAYETMLKILTKTTVEWPICKEHGRCKCPECTKAKAPLQGTFCLAKTTPKDFVVIDSASQLGDSIMNYACRSQGQGYKPGWDEYGLQGRELNAAFGAVQAARYCNFIVITQKLIVDMDPLGKVDSEGKREKVYPLAGTKSFSSKFGKYFAHRIYLQLKNKKHIGGSSTKYEMDILTGSRSDWRVEKLETLTMEVLYEHIKRVASGEEKEFEDDEVVTE